MTVFGGAFSFLIAYEFQPFDHHGELEEAVTIQVHAETNNHYLPRFHGLVLHFLR